MIDATPILCGVSLFILGMVVAFNIRKEPPPDEPIYKLVARQKRRDVWEEWGEESEKETSR